MARRTQPEISNSLFAFVDTLGLQVNLAGTGDTDRVEVQRALLLADFALRTLAPLILVQARLPQARVLRACLPITDQYSAKGATAAVYRMRDMAHTLAQQAHAQGDFDAATKTFATAALNEIASICWAAGTAAATKADAGYSLNCAVAVAHAIKKAIDAGIPEQELLDLALGAVADAMVIE